MILLNDEEIRNRWIEAYEEQNLESVDSEDLRNNLYYEDMYALKAVAKAYLKKAVEWGNEYCVWHPSRLPNGSLWASKRRHQCHYCWQALLDEVKDG